jgi:UDP-glucose 4-epimerase
MRRSHRPATAIERDVVDAEAAVVDFALKQPEVDVTVLRCTYVLGPDVETAFSRMFSLPAVPGILGFDPRCQYVHEDDVVHALEHATINRVPGVFNIAGDGVLALSEAAGLLGKRVVPALPPWGAGMLAGPLRAVGVRIPDEMLPQLRFGRGLDNRRYKASGFEYGYTSREAVVAFAKHLRLHPILRGIEHPYTYEGEVERFLRRSPLTRPPASEEQTGTEREPFGI